MAALHRGADFVRQRDDPCLPIPWKRPQREHVAQNRFPLPVADAKERFAVLCRGFGVVVRLGFSRGRHRLEVVGAEVVQQTGPGGRPRITAQLPGNQPAITFRYLIKLFSMNNQVNKVLTL